MKSLLILAFLLGIAIPASAGTSEKTENMFAVAFDEDFTPIGWIDLHSIQFKDKHSFKYSVKSQTQKGLLYYQGNFNCKTKQYSFLTDDFERPVVPGSTSDVIGQIVCRESASRELWGFNQDNESLWDASEPKQKPGLASGEWIPAGEGGVMYNDDIKISGDLVMYAQFNNYKIADALKSDANYQWVLFRCNDNFASIYFKPVGATEGFWTSPVPMSPNGSARVVKKAVCR